MPQIAINLLPQAAQHGKRAAGTKFQIPLGLPRRIAIIAGSLVATGVLIVLVVAGLQQQSAARTQREWDALNAQRARLAQLQAEQMRLEARYAVLSKLVETYPVWAERLNRLSDLVPEGVWLSKLALDAPGKLILEGSALERAGEGMQTVSRFSTALQAEKTFTSVFNQITLQSFKSRTAGATDVLDFAMVCTHSVAAPTGDSAKPKH